MEQCLRLPSLLNATLDDLKQGLTHGHFTSAQLVRTYAAGVAEVNHVAHAVIELNTEAEAIAQALDQERAKSGPRSALHGIPFLLKDNIVTLDQTTATCGSTALLGTIPPAEAGIVTILRKAGAIILGKANLSEFSGFRHTNASTGWSARGGQATGIFWPNMKASGSSTGSAACVGLGLAFASFGTETVSSIVTPSEKSCVVGFKPTLSVLPTDGVIPVSKRQDTMGYIARTVKDVAQLLDVLVQFDPRSSTHGQKTIYADSCHNSDFQGVRVGVVKYSEEEIAKHKADAFHEILGLLTQAGATILDNVELAGLKEYELLPEAMKTIVLETEMKADMEAYLASLTENPRGILTFENLINAIKSEHSEEYPSRNVDTMLRALHTSKESAEYLAMLQNQEYYTDRGGFEGAMDRCDCDVMIAPAGPLSLQGFAAIGGDPVMTVPMGFYPEETEVRREKPGAGLVLALLVWSQLLRVAHAFEQLSGAQKRAKPYLLPRTDLRDIVHPKGTDSKIG
ncbi:amidase [Apiosordaria backusii]|uniref:Amidase n=1 Tax=Apiosordaria backusii TaxID=314023 RepID=A0AA40EHY7_9PEZI|nr:amidase [Apiosordaria backusii]